MTPPALALVALLFFLFPRHHMEVVRCAVNVCLPGDAYIAVVVTHVGIWPIKTACAFYDEQGERIDRAHCRVSTRRFIGKNGWWFSYFEYDAAAIAWTRKDFNL